MPVLPERSEPSRGTEAPSDHDHAFSLHDVRQVRGEVVTLESLDMTLPRGGITTLFGPSGAGKSALLRLLNRLDDPVTGEIRYGGQPIMSFPVRELRRRVGFVFQVATPFPGTVADNLTVAAGIAGVAPDTVEATMHETVSSVGLTEDLLTRDASRLSVGQLQRVGIARALMTGPETLLMDEPTASLDPETADTLLQTVSSLAERGLTIVMASHRLEEAERLSHYAVMLDAGVVVEAGPAVDVFASDHPRLRAFLDRVT
jgi:ABC-type methionine transport system ATPase subunit